MSGKLDGHFGKIAGADPGGLGRPRNVPLSQRDENLDVPAGGTVHDYRNDGNATGTLEPDIRIDVEAKRGNLEGERSWTESAAEAELAFGVPAPAEGGAVSS